MKKFKILSKVAFILLALFAFNSKANGHFECQATKLAQVQKNFGDTGEKNVTELIYSDFSSFQEIHLGCDLARLEGNSSFSVRLRNLELAPKDPVMFNQTFDLTVLNTDNAVLAQTVFLNIAGFDLELGRAFLVNQAMSNFINIGVSNMEFYYRSQLVDEELCKSGRLSKLNITLFAGLNNSYLSFFEADNVNHPVCPFVLKNAEIRTLLVANMKDTILSRNRMTFIPLDGPGSPGLDDLNARIHEVVYDSIYRVSINRKLLNEYVLRNTKYVSIFGSFKSIEPTVFKNLPNIQHLRLELANTREFLHSSDNMWLSSLFASSLSLDSLVHELQIAFIDMSNNYNYPDEDFCLFKYFPADRYFLTFLGRMKGNDQVSILKLDGSCTFTYLIQNNRKVYVKLGMPETYYTDVALSNGVEINRCEFEKKIDWCNNNSAKVSSSIDINSYDITYALEWFEFIGPIVTFPVVAITGFTLNLLVILIIVSHRNKQEKFFEQKLYKYILMNSVFNCVECFISVFGLMSECIGRESIYCSSIEAYAVTQYFRIYVVGYLGEIMKTCSILNGLAFSLERYVVTAQPKNKYLVKFGHARVRHVCVVILVTGSLTSVEKIFEFHVDRMNVADYDLPNSMHINSYFGFSASHFFYFFHYVLNDFVLLFVNIIVDIKLARIIREDLKLKEEVQTRLEHIPSSHVYQLSKDHKTNKTVDVASERKLAEQKTNSMIISSLIVYLICRLPELASVFFIYFFHTYQSGDRSDCTLISLCSLFFDAIEYIYMISYILNIIFYYRFNKNFRHGFRHFFKLNIKKVKTKRQKRNPKNKKRT